jgi:GNAT superfamily N-acetyltransferase
MLAEAAAGRPPAADGAVDVLPRAAGGAVAAVIGFTAHHVVAADVDPGWVRAVLPPGSLSAPMSARFVGALADRVGAEPGAYDTVLVAPPGRPVPTGPGRHRPAPGAVPAAAGAGPGAVPAAGGGGPGAVPAAGRAPGAGVLVGPAVALREVAGAESARVRRAERFRTGVRAWAVEGAVLVVGRGLAGRWEVALEVEPAYRGRGLGRALAAAAPGLVPPGEPLWAQVSPANVASLRAFLAAGYRPVAAEILLI